MGRARRARRIAAAAAFGGSGLAGLGAAGLWVLVTQARLARRWIGTPFGKQGPDASGTFGGRPGALGERPGIAIELAMLGDSSAVGLGVDDPLVTPGAVIADGLAAVSGRPVTLCVVARVGAETRHLDSQLDVLDRRDRRPDVAVIMIGANDVTHRTRPSESVRALEGAVRRLRAMGAEVVVGTCPDLGTIEPLAQPLKFVARRLSRQLAAAQTIAVVEAGGRTVSLGNLLGPEFASRPREMFSQDRFHPSAAGYARAGAALLPSVCAVLGLLPPALLGQRPDLRIGEGVDDVVHAAVRAAAAPGTEVAGAQVGGASRGPHGRWAVLLRRARAAPGSAPAGRSEGAVSAVPPAGGDLSVAPR